MYVVLVCKEALQRNAIQIWLRLEEKLSAQLTDEVSRWVHRYFMQIVTAAHNVSFNNTLYAAAFFILSIMFYRHATSSVS